MINTSQLTEEKLNKIINAGLTIFSSNTYKKSSVNNIVAISGIAKGSFFNYFENKFEFYKFLYEFCIKTLNDEFISKINIMETDFIKRMLQISSLKMIIICKFPMMTSFLLKAYFETEPCVKEYVVNTNTNYINNNSYYMFGNIDTSNFKDGVTVKDAFSIITYVSEGIAKNYTSLISDYSKMVKEFEHYLNILKYSFYKEEYIK